MLDNVRISRFGDVHPFDESGRAELALLAVLGVVGRTPPFALLPRASGAPGDCWIGVLGEGAKSRLLGSVRRMDGTWGMYRSVMIVGRLSRMSGA